MISRTFFCVLFLTVLLNGVVGKVHALGTASREYVIIIGNNRHVDDESRTLQLADDDAAATFEHFRRFHPDARIWLLTELDESTRKIYPGIAETLPTPPTYAAWERTLEEVRADLSDNPLDSKERSKVILFFAGHGDKTGSLHLVDRRLDKDHFKQDLAGLGADEVFAVLDGCYLGEAVRGDDESETPMPDEAIFDELNSLDWLFLIGATTPVPDPDRLGHGIITTLAISALSGPADTDGDARITFRELAVWMTSEIRRFPDAPTLKAFNSRKDWLATVVDLERSGLGGIRLEPGFPSGRIWVRKPGSEARLVDVQLRGAYGLSVYLEPGEYEVISIAEIEKASEDGYQAIRAKATVARGMVSLDGSTPNDPITLKRLDRGDEHPGVLDASEGAVVWISEHDERLLLDNPYLLSRLPGTDILPSRWQLSIQAGLPGYGVDLSEAEDSRPGAVVRLARFGTLWNVGRFFVSGGALMQYGIHSQPDMFPSSTAVPASTLRHEARLGLVSQQLWSGRSFGISFEQSLAWAPGWVTSGAALVTDDTESPIDGGAAIGSAGQWKYVYPFNWVGEVSFGFHVPIGRRWTLGPTVRAEILNARYAPWAAIFWGQLIRQSGHDRGSGRLA